MGHEFGVGGADPGLPVDGGTPDEGNLLISNNPDNANQSVTLTVTSRNAAGNAVPLENVEYTIIDIDRSCNRIDGPPINGPDGPPSGPNSPGEIWWQDVISTRFLQGANGVAPTTLSIGETVENIGIGADALVSYAVPANAVTFRGIADPTPETLSNANGNDGCSGNPNPNFGSNDDNRGIEAANNLVQGPAGEGNARVSSGLNTVDGLEFRYGTGVLDAASNGLGEDLAPNPQGHALGVLSDFSFRPGIIGIAKSASAPIPDLNTPGNFLTTITLNIENLGELDLSDIQVTDDLAATFPAGFTIASQPVITNTTGNTTSLVANPAYDGAAATNIFQPGGTLDDNDANGDGDIGTATVEFTVSFDPGGATSFTNQAQAQGTTPGGGITTDLSDDGLDPDSDGNEDPTGPGQDDPTPINILPTPSIGVTKQVLGTPVANPNGTYTITYRQIVRNLGTEALNNVSLTDEDFGSTYRVGTATGVTSATFVPSSVSVPGAAPAGFPTGYVPLTGSGTFNGTPGNLQLATVASLPVGGYGIVDYQVTVDPTDPIDGSVENLGDGTLGSASPDDDNPYESQVTAQGTGATSTTTTVTDLSDDVTGFPAAADQLPRDLSNPANGTATDPESAPGAPQANPIPANDPSAATNENNRTPVTFAGQPAIALSKRVTNVTANADGTFDVTYRQLVQNIGSVTLDNVQIAEDTSILDTFRVGLPNGATSAQVLSVTPVAPGTVAPGASGGVDLIVGTPADLEGPSLNLLSVIPGENTLLPGEFGAVDYVVRVLPGNNTAGYGGNGLPFSSQATATGTATSLVGAPVVTDPSDDGVEFPKGTPGASAIQTLDPDNNNNANEGAATLILPDDDGNTITAATQDSENNPTPVRFPKLAISKNISDVTGSGIPGDPYIVTYDVTVQNVGGIRLNEIQVTEQSIDDVFNDLTPTGNATLVAGSLTSTGVNPTTPNAAFDGETVLGLIDPGALLTLDPDESSSLQYQVQLVGPIELPTRPDPYTSSSTASGTGIPSDSNGPVAGNPLTVSGDANADGVPDPGSNGVMPVSDLSDDGTNPDPNTTDGNRGSGAGENDPTPITFPVGPQIGLTKQVISTVPVPGQPGSFDVTFEYRVQNIGIVPLNGLDITDNYDTQFDIGEATAVTNYEVRSITPLPAETPGGPTLVGNGAVVGSMATSGNLSVATGGATVFAPGEAARTRVVVRVTPDPDNLSTVYANSAIATGTQSNSTVVPAPIATDLSDDIPLAGATDPRLLTPNPNTLGGSTPTISADDATPVIFDLIPVDLQLFKTITSTSRGDDFTGIQEVPGAPPGVVGTIRVPEQLQPGDTVEYRIYYFNGGTTTFSGLEICDPLPSPLTPVLPITNGSFIAPLTPVPAGNISCPVNEAGLAVQVDANGNPTSEPNGAAIFSVGDVPPGTLDSVVFEAQIP